MKSVVPSQYSGSGAFPLATATVVVDGAGGAVAQGTGQISLSVNEEASASEALGPPVIKQERVTSSRVWGDFIEGTKHHRDK